MKILSEDHVNKAEKDDEDLSYLSEQTITKILSDKIYDSTITIVLITPNMRDKDRSDRDQWIPWEISYSLREQTRHDCYGNPVISHANAIIGVVIPDYWGQYDYYLIEKKCCERGCIITKNDVTFDIINKNRLNRKRKEMAPCHNLNPVYPDDTNYILITTWAEFVSEPNQFINEAIKRQEKIDEYEIVKTI